MIFQKRRARMSRDLPATLRRGSRPACERCDSRPADHAAPRLETRLRAPRDSRPACLLGYTSWLFFVLLGAAQMSRQLNVWWNRTAHRNKIFSSVTWWQESFDSPCLRACLSQSCRRRLVPKEAAGIFFYELTSKNSQWLYHYKKKRCRREPIFLAKYS